MVLTTRQAKQQTGTDKGHFIKHTGEMNIYIHVFSLPLTEQSKN